MTHTGTFCADSLRNVYPEPVTVPENAWWVLVRGDEVLVRPGGEPDVIFCGSPAGPGVSLQGRIYLGFRDALPCYAGELSMESPVPSGWQAMRLRDLFGLVPDADLAIAAFGVRLADYDRKTRFCGRCGNRARPSVTERAKECGSCGLVTYPRLSPAVIVLVQNGDRALLARSSRQPDGMYGLVAGFVEAGENLEHAVAREVMEETGIRVKNLRYFGSEPWPFPDSLMIGFTAEYDGGEIAVDHHEIESAFWADRENLPRIPGKLSISRALIDWWRAGGQ